MPKCLKYIKIAQIILLSLSAVFLVFFPSTSLAKEVLKGDKPTSRPTEEQYMFNSGTNIDNKKMVLDNTLMNLSDKDGESIVINLTEYKYLKDKIDIYNDSIEEISKSVKFYRNTVQKIKELNDYTKLNTKANYPFDQYVHWDNWQKNSIIDYTPIPSYGDLNKTNGNPYNWYWHSNFAFQRSQLGDTKGFLRILALGQYVYKNTNTYAQNGNVSISGNIERVYDDSDALNANLIGPSYNTTYNTAPLRIMGDTVNELWYLFAKKEIDKIYLGLDIKEIFFIPELVGERVQIDGNYHYASNQQNGADDRSMNSYYFDQTLYPGYTAQSYINEYNTKTMSVVTYEDVSPQIIKVLHINKNDGSLLAQEEFGRGLYMNGKNFPIKAKKIPGYIATGQDYYYRNAIPRILQQDPINLPNYNMNDTSMDRHQQLFVFYYEESDVDLDITKENSHSSTGASIDDEVLYTIKVSNKGADTQKHIAIEDVFPPGMIFDQSQNISINSSISGKINPVKYSPFSGMSWYISKDNIISNGYDNRDVYSSYQEPSTNYAQGKATIYINLAPNETKTIRYYLRVGYGNIGDTKTNTVNIKNELLNLGISDSSSFKIVNPEVNPDIRINKVNDKETEGAGYGEQVTYKLTITNNSDKSYDENHLIIKDVGPPNLVLTNINSLKVYNSSGEEEESQGFLYQSAPGVSVDNIFANPGKHLFSTQGTYSTGQTLWIYLHIRSGETKTIEYTETLYETSVGLTKTNVAEVMKNTSVGLGVKDSSSFTTTESVPKFVIDKSADKETAKVGDIITYTIKFENKGGKESYPTNIVDTLPQGMSSPTNIKEILSNGSSNTLFPTWNSSQRTLSFSLGFLWANRGIRTFQYQSTVLDDQPRTKINTVVISGKNNSTGEDAESKSDTATVTISGKIKKLNIKQEVIDPNSHLVIPSIDNIYLDNIMVNNSKNIKNSSGLSIPSYIVDTNQAYKTVSLEPFESYKGYLPKLMLSSFYEYAGYNLTDVESTHKSSELKEEPLPIIDYTDKDEYWLTIYIKPKNYIGIDGPPFYNWDYALNNFGDGNIKVK